MEEIDIIEEEFPKKAEFGTLIRKRLGIRKQYFKRKRMSQSPYYPMSAYLVDKNGDYLSVNELDKAVRYKRQWRGKASKGIKKECNRKFRRNKTEVSRKGNNYRKATEFWWELY
jgi:hypothetical protein